MTLKRETLEVLPDELPKNINILNFAEKELGYMGVKVKTQRAEAPLAKALHTMGCRPFTEQSIQKYKEKLNKKVEWDNSFAWINWFFGVRVVLFCILFAKIWSLASNPSGGREFAIVFSSLFYITFEIIWNCIKMSKRTKKQGTWHSWHLNGYIREIPEFVLETAVEVKQRCPKVVFYIEEFFVIDKIEKKLVDPFLIAELGNEKYYLEVWDEPTFKGQRKV